MIYFSYCQLLGTFGGLGAAGLSASLLTSVLPTAVEDLLALGLCSAGGYAKLYPSFCLYTLYLGFVLFQIQICVFENWIEMLILSLYHSFIGDDSVSPLAYYFHILWEA